MRVVDGSKAALVQKLGGRYVVGLHGHHGLGGRHDIREVNHGAGLVRRDGQRLHGHFRKEGQRTLGTYEQVGQDFKRIFVGYEGPQVQACDVFDAILITDTLRQLFIGHHFLAQGFQAFHNFRMLFPEGRFRFLGGGVQHSTVGQHHAGAEQHLVGIRMRTAAHTGGVVVHDTAHHATADGSRIGAEMPSEGGQMLIYLGSHYARLQGDGGILMVLPLLPMLAGHQQDAVGNGLSGKRGARRTEGNGKVVSGCQFQYLRHFLFVGRPQDYLGGNLVFSGIGSPGQGAEFVGIDAAGRKDALHGLKKLFCHSVSSANCFSKRVLRYFSSRMMALRRSRGSSLGEPLIRSLR